MIVLLRNINTEVLKFKIIHFKETLKAFSFSSKKKNF